MSKIDRDENAITQYQNIKNKEPDESSDDYSFDEFNESRTHYLGSLLLQGLDLLNALRKSGLARHKGEPTNEYLTRLISENGGSVRMLRLTLATDVTWSELQEFLSSRP
jgi:hypothetical protein